VGRLVAQPTDGNVGFRGLQEWPLPAEYLDLFGNRNRSGRLFGSGAASSIVDGRGTLAETRVAFRIPRHATVGRSLNFFTGGFAAKAVPDSTRRAVGQFAASLARGGFVAGSILNEVRLRLLLALWTVMCWFRFR